MTAYLAFEPKDTLEVLDYPVQWGSWLVSGAALSTVGGDCTAVLEGTSTPGGLSDLVIDSTQVVGTDFVLWLSGGTDRETYTILCTVQDDQSPTRTGVRRVRITMALK